MKSLLIVFLLSMIGALIIGMTLSLWPVIINLTPWDFVSFALYAAWLGCILWGLYSLTTVELQPVLERKKEDSP